MKTVFVVVGYENAEKDLSRMYNSCQIEVFAKDEKTAIDLAKKYIKKKHYTITNIIEKDE